MMILSKIISILKEARSVCILPHVSADGDAIGSSIALALALRKLMKSAKVVLEEEVPYIYDFLPHEGICHVYDGKALQYDVVVALDTGDMNRLGKRAEIFNMGGITINVDHHQTNSEFAFYNHVDISSAATGEIVYQMVKLMGIDLDNDISNCLYVALATDTGGFRFGNTTAITHQIAGDLINNGVNVSDVSQKLFERVSLEKVKLMGESINSIQIIEEGKIAFITILDEVMKRIGAKDEDCDGIINIARNINGVEVAVMLRQKSSTEIRVNFRSNSYVDVSKIASKYSGGGHKRASGCTVNNMDLSEIKELLVKDIKLEL